MNKFNLERAKNGAALVTRGGLPARLLCTDRKNTDNFSVVAVVDLSKYGDLIEQVIICDSYGNYHGDMSESEYDLFMALTDFVRYTALDSCYKLISPKLFHTKDEVGLKYPGAIIGEVRWKK